MEINIKDVGGNMYNSKYKEALDRIEETYYNLDNCLSAMKRFGKDVQTLSELVDKENPKKPDYEGDGYDDNGQMTYDTWICPNCGKRYEVDYDDYDYCPNCGQALDLGEENE